MKKLLLALIITFSTNIQAATDEEFLSFNKALNDGNVKQSLSFIKNKTFTINEFNFGYTPLMISINNQHIKLVEVLIKEGADINLPHPVTKMTPLGMAVANNDFLMVKTLLEHKANPNVLMSGDITPIRIAEENGFPNIVHLLQIFGAKKDLGCQENKCF